MRTLIDLPSRDINALNEHAKRHGLSRAALVREAVAEYLQNHGSANADEAFGLLADQPLDSLAWQDQMRDEWSR